MKNIILLLLLIPSFLVGQNIDTDRMNRDIKVAENGLKSLIQLGTSSSHFASTGNSFFSINSRDVEGQYIKDYGVILTADICEPCFKNKVKKKGDENSFSIVNHLVTAGETFLADYGSIIGQLSNDQNIMIRFTDEGNNHFPRSLIVTDGAGANTLARTDNIITHNIYGSTNRTESDQNSESQEITVEVSVADLKANMAGNISRDALIAKIKTESKVITFEPDPQLETFTAMFHRLYQKDLTSTYFMSSRPSYSKISNVGIMIKARVYSSNIYDNKRYSMPTVGKKDLSLEERNSIVVDMLPEFEKVFKENIVSYTRTIRSLEKGKSIMFEVRLTECKGCNDFPKYMNFSINQDILDQFNKGKMSFDQAVGKVSVEKRGA